ncbi:MAG: hypothetical protein KatS3mg130_1936 [Candidatus Sumerlaea sp.]|nr:MAG: hypothetical protein KatS3mg130_1936 [Candidatus Sumerlaea sp.]
MPAYAFLGTSPLPKKQAQLGVTCIPASELGYSFHGFGTWQRRPVRAI